MSKSRLEKFLYALYSLDSSDLPTPLSRIEELYKCLVTGDETPTFEPLSRVEKYLMAILGGYDVELLPNPLSRVEALLYKLATGDDNLDDFEIFLSKHEELLAEIIRNGGVGGNIDIKYVLHTLSTEFNTLYNTAEKPVKSAILKGDTMVNIAQITSHNFDEYRTPIQDLNKPLEIGKQYTIIVNIVSQTVKLGFTLRLGKDNSFVGIKTFNGVRLHKFLYNATNDFNQIAPYIELREWNEGLCLEYNQLMIIEGDYTNVDIPYFEGMQSVKMPVLTTRGKNLVDNSKNQYADINSDTGLETIVKHSIVTDYIPYLYGTTYTASSYINGVENIHISMRAYDKDKNYQGTTPNVDTAYIRLRYFKGSDITSNEILFQFEYGSTKTPYEPFKSNILTVNEDVTLRSNGDACDELNLLTGRLTQRIDENNEVLAQAVVKTVDLSVVNQDGNDTKLSTFNDITHVTLSSEGLIPEAELEVATKNEEVLNTMSLEMDDISTSQNTLKETTDIQSENVDATMIATTEIYEGLL